MPEFHVRGSIQNALNARTRIVVRAFDRDMRREELLGEAVVNTKGFYEIGYDQSQFRRAEKQRADLIVRAYGPDGSQLAVSGPIFNAEQVAVVDLTIDEVLLGVPSEYERNEAELAPLVEDVQHAELTDDDIAFLHGEAGIPVEQLTFLRLADGWGTKVDLPGAAFYGLLRHGLPATFECLIATPGALVRSTLKQAIAAGTIPSELSQSLERLVQQIEALAVAEALGHAIPDPKVVTATIGATVGVTRLNDDQREQVLRLAQNFEGARLWGEMDKDPKLGPTAVEELRFATGVGQLAAGHLPTMRAVAGRKVAAGLKTPRDLAALTRDEWHGIAAVAAEAGPLPPGFKTAAAYGAALADRVEEAFLSDVIRHAVSRNPSLGSPALASFLTNFQTFDFHGPSVDDQLAKADLSQVKDPAALRTELKTLHRVSRILPAGDRINGMETLIAAGYDSSAKVVRGGKQRFKKAAAARMGDARAENTYRIAEDRVRATHMVQQYVRDYTDVDPTTVIPGFELTPDEPASWVGMFGSKNGCECEECRSIHGPAAYLVDLLHFLHDAPVDEGNLLEALLRRRGDIERILLDCKNALTPLPYIDLVNELLEEVVAPLPILARPSATATEAERHAYEVWLERYQTSKEAGELRARPEHEHRPAYQTLVAAVFPWALPFDIDDERARALFGWLKVDRPPLTALFQGTPEEVARVRLGLGTHTWALVTRSDTSPALNDNWGLPVIRLHVLNVAVLPCGEGDEQDKSHQPWNPGPAAQPGAPPKHHGRHSARGEQQDG